MKFERLSIGENAGKIWRYLNANPDSSMTKICEGTGLKKDEVLLAIGWLFREEKLEGEKKSGSYVLNIL
ncbi:MAG: winged helix-turn-helix domain-containing protein [Candidatus Delongbacteria bacterium]|nr:winged helix-turn-helix domain-containing protein [Candidatus Delongbacteria bacterium]MBN2835048.1 winged helix-turn-helix domain-containing protein [Candidatus Delongbacteria bacterium]